MDGRQSKHQCPPRLFPSILHDPFLHMLPPCSFSCLAPINLVRSRPSITSPLRAIFSRMNGWVNFFGSFFCVPTSHVGLGWGLQEKEREVDMGGRFLIERRRNRAGSEHKHKHREGQGRNKGLGARMDGGPGQAPGNQIGSNGRNKQSKASGHAYAV